MKLYITPTSPYARIARMVILEKDLANRVEIIGAQTRRDDSPYYAVNPSGRVPYPDTRRRCRHGGFHSDLHLA